MDTMDIINTLRERKKNKNITDMRNTTFVKVTKKWIFYRIQVKSITSDNCIVENKSQYRLFKKAALVSVVDNIYWINYKDMVSINNLKVLNHVSKKFAEDILYYTSKVYDISLPRENIINLYNDKHRIIN